MWSSWNHLNERSAGGRRPVPVTYWMNRLQHPPNREPLFVTLNPVHPPAADTVIKHMCYDHPCSMPPR